MENKVKKFEARNNDFTIYTLVRNHFYKSVTGNAVISGENGVVIVPLVDVRIGRTESAHTAIVNVVPYHYVEKFWTKGQGKAVGGGYHRESAALEYAFLNAGIQLENAFSGHGEGAEIEAVKAVTRYVAENTMREGEKLLAVDTHYIGF